MLSPGRILRIVRKHQKELRYQQWREQSGVSETPAVLVGGCPRTGTTLLRVLLDAHRNLCCPPETALFHEPWRDEQLARVLETDAAHIASLRPGPNGLTGFIDRVMADYARRNDRPRWVEKSPANVQHLPWIFEHFPNTKFIHMIRDGRDAICSLRTHPRYKMIDGQRVPRDTWNPVDQCARKWVLRTRTGMGWRGHPGYREFRYEDLVARPDETLKAACEFIGEPFDPAMLGAHARDRAASQAVLEPQNVEATKPISESSVGRWHTDLTDEDVAVARPIINALLLQLGYADAPDWQREPR